MNLSATIIPKSDQLNADDLISGPRTITITAVNGPGKGEQPTWIQYEGGEGRPYKPGLSMRRVLVAMWGSEGGAYVGRSLTLYCDPSITFGPDTTGGIRISHASDIAAPHTMPLTVKRGKRKVFTVEPMATTTNRPMDELIAAGDAIATIGTDKLRLWWANRLTDAERQSLGGKDGARLTAWKLEAGTANSA